VPHREHGAEIAGVTALVSQSLTLAESGASQRGALGRRSTVGIGERQLIS